MNAAVELLFAKRSIRFRWLAVAPALVALLFFGMALDDVGPAGAVPYATVVLLVAVYIARPMFIFWAPVFAAFVVYSGLVLIDPWIHSANGTRSGDWIVFLLLSGVPAFVLWLARPHSRSAARNGVEAPVLPSRADDAE